MSDPGLEEIGRAMYGQHWRNQLADDLGVHVRTLRRWLAGTMDIPPGIWSDLDAILAERALIMNSIRSKLKGK